MKTKRFDKKLAFNKKTIADLNNLEMNAVQGGTIITCTIVTCGEPLSGYKWCETRKSDCCVQC
jgi:hypothetical protein